MIEKLIQREQSISPTMVAIKDYLQTEKLPPDKLARMKVIEMAPMYEVNSKGALCRVRQRGKEGELGMEMQMVVPEKMQGMVIEAAHQGIGCHESVIKTFQKVRARYWWPGLYADVHRFVKYCAKCQLNARVRTSAPISKHITAAEPGEVVVIDLLHYPKAAGYKYVLTIIDAYSRWGEMEPIQNKEAATIAAAFIKATVTNTHGQMQVVVSDQGSEFAGDMQAAMELLKIERKHTAAYRSEGHGMVERFNQAISEKLKTIISQEDLEWHRGLPWVKLAYNSAPHAALTMGGEGLSPAEVHIGRKLRMEVHEEEIEEEEKLKKAPSLYVQQLKKHLENVHAWTKKSQEEYNTKMRAIANKRKKRRHRQWQPGDTVRLEVPDGAKLQDKYDGPYEVLSRDTDYEYTIRKIGSIKIKTQVHANRLADFNDIMEDAANKKEEQQGKIVWAENVQVMEDDEEEEQDTVKAIKKEKQEAEDKGAESNKYA